MKRILPLFFCFSSIIALSQEISFKAGINPTFMDHEWGALDNRFTFKGGWGYKAGFDFSYAMNKRWVVFHGLNIDVSKYKYSNSSTFLNGQNEPVSSLYEQGYIPVSLSMPIGVGRRFQAFNREAEVRSVLDWNFGIGGKVTSHEFTITKNEWDRSNIVYRTDHQPSSNTFRLKRFKIGTEFKYEFVTTFSLDLAYSYCIDDRMNITSISEPKTAGGHSLFIGVNWKFLKYKE